MFATAAITGFLGAVAPFDQEPDAPQLGCALAVPVMIALVAWHPAAAPGLLTAKSERLWFRRYGRRRSAVLPTLLPPLPAAEVPTDFGPEPIHVEAEVFEPAGATPAATRWVAVVRMLAGLPDSLVRLPPRWGALIAAKQALALDPSSNEAHRALADALRVARAPRSAQAVSDAVTDGTASGTGWVASTWVSYLPAGLRPDQVRLRQNPLTSSGNNRALRAMGIDPKDAAQGGSLTPNQGVRHDLRAINAARQSRNQRMSDQLLWLAEAAGDPDAVELTHHRWVWRMWWAVWAWVWAWAVFAPGLVRAIPAPEIAILAVAVAVLLCAPCLSRLRRERRATFARAWRVWRRPGMWALAVMAYAPLAMDAYLAATHPGGWFPDSISGAGPDPGDVISATPLLVMTIVLVGSAAAVLALDGHAHLDRLHRQGADAVPAGGARRGQWLRGGRAQYMPGAVSPLGRWNGAITVTLVAAYLVSAVYLVIHG